MQRTALALCSVIAFTAFNVNVIAVAEDPPQTIQSLLAEARDAQSRRDFNAAAESYRKAVALDPSVPELWADLGLMEHQTGQFDRAIKSFTEAARRNSSLYVPQLFLGIDNLELKRTQAAIPFLERAEELNPTDPQASFMLGRAFSIAGDGDSSSEAYWRAVTLAPSNGNAWLGLGMAYLQRVDSEARVMTTTYESSNYTKLRAGELFAEQGKLVQAARAYNDELLLSSSLPCSHAGYGIVLLRQNLIAEAKAEIDRESSPNSGCPLTRLGLAGLKLVHGDTENALQDLIAIWNADAGFLRDDLPMLRDGITDEQTGKLVGLAKDWQADSKIPQGFIEAILSGLEPNTPVLSDLDRFGVNHSAPERAEALPTLQDPKTVYLSGQFGKCSEGLRPRWSVLPEKSLLILAQCAFYAGDYRTTSMAARRLASISITRLVGLYWESRADQKLAIAALTRAGDIDANSPRMHVLLGDLYRQKRRWEAAESEYRKALVLEPESRVGRIGLAISLFQDGKSEEAFANDRNLLQENPEDSEANLLAAEIFVQRWQYTDAETYLNKCRSDIPLEFMPRVHALLGEVYSNTDRIQQALSEFKLGTKSDADGSIHYQMAHLYLKTGDRKAAAEAFQVSKQLREKWDASASVAVEQSSTDLSRK